MQLACFFAVLALLVVLAPALVHHKELEDEPSLATLTPKRATNLIGHNMVHLKAEAATRRVKSRRKEKFGPDNCVSVWRDSGSGKCWMETNCKKDVDLSVYEFGLMCIDEDDKAVRHIFGMDSFKHKEKFNTLIKCKECRALHEYMDTDKALKTLFTGVTAMQKDLTTVNAEIQSIKVKAGFAPAAAPGPAAAQAPAPPPAQLLLGAEGRADGMTATKGKAFDKADTNRDGMINGEELHVALKAAKKNGKAEAQQEAEEAAQEETEDEGQTETDEKAQQDGEEQSVDELEQSQESSSEEEEDQQQTQESDSQEGEEEQSEESNTEGAEEESSGDSAEEEDSD